MSRQFKVYKIFLLILFVISMYPWFTWGLNLQYFSLIGAIYTLFLLSNGTILSYRKEYTPVVVLFLFLFLWIGKYNNIFGQLENILNWIILIGILSLKEEYKTEVIPFITKWFAILLGISLIVYVAAVVGVPLPSSSITRGTYIHTFTNYYLCIKIDGMMRFQSVFLEPGHMTMGLAPLLFLNKYDYKNKYVVILLLAQLFSFSLAGYIIMVIGYIYTVLFSSGERKISRIIFPIVVFAGFMGASTTIFEEDLFNDLIMARLEWSGDSISGYNRSSDYLDFQYEKVLHSPVKWFGEEWDSEMSEKGVAGYKLFFVMYGIIGVLAVILSYITTTYRKNSNTMLSWGFLLVLFLLLYQDAYPTWWCVLIALVYSNNVLQNQNT